MARDRRRAKQRRERQARTAGGSVRRDEGRATPAAPAVGPEYTHDPAKPQERASGDVDLADAQLALGRPELIDATQPRPEELAGAATESEVEADEEAFEQLEDRVDAAEEAYEEGASYEEEEAIAAGVPANGHVAEGAEVVRTRRRAPGSRGRATASSRSCEEAGASCNEYSGRIVGRSARPQRSSSAS